MDAIDHALLDAWNRLAPRLRADRLEAARRHARTRRPILTRPVRPWCLCIRASDTRLESKAIVQTPPDVAINVAPDADSNTRQHVYLDHQAIRDLTAPVYLDWPGVDWTTAADRLGRHPESLRRWIDRDLLRCTRYNAVSCGKRGKPVPHLWSTRPLDPSANHADHPPLIWGTLWQSLAERVPADAQGSLTRTPHYGRYKGRPRQRGWSFTCPGLERPAPRLRLAGADDNTTERNRCGRSVRRLFLPIPVQSIIHHLDPDLALDLPAPLSPWFPSASTPALPGEISDEPASQTEAARSPSDASTRLPFACHHCYRVRYVSLLGRNGWNTFIAHLTAGLLYGHEVKRPHEETPAVRKRRYAPRPRPAPRREQVQALLLRAHTYKEIAGRLGIQTATVASHVKRIYRLHDVHSRAELIARLDQTPDTTPRPSEPARAHTA